MDAAPVSANATAGFTSMLANNKYAAAVNLPQYLDDAIETVQNASAWQILLTLFLMCVLYDQCTCGTPDRDTHEPLIWKERALT